MVRKGRRVRGVVVAGLVLGGFLGAGSPARATAPGVEFTGLYADNNEHFFFHYDLEDVSQDAVEWARKYALDPPSALVTEKDEFYGVQTDVVSYDEDYTGSDAPFGMEAPCWDTCPRNTLATTWCTSTDGVNAADKCQQFKIYFDLPDVQGFNVAQRNWLACHELGHTVGFDDPVEGGPQDDTSCTRYYWSDFPASPVTLYGDHDRNHMIDRYGRAPAGGACDVGGGHVMGAPGTEAAGGEFAICPAPDVGDLGGGFT